MKNVLVVDDEETLLLIMVNRFEDYADQFNVYTARNGKEAVNVLETESIDFLVTDLKMPEMDGIELLALMSSKYPHIPAMAMSAFSTPEIEKKLAQMGTLRVLDKPVNFDLLADHIIRGLDRSHEGGSLNCVSVSSFLQLIKMEDKTCALEVHGENNQRGYIYIKHGELYDAECDDVSGEKAALEIIAWDSSQLFIKDLPRDKQENKINKGLMSVVMEGVRLKDEKDAARAAEAPAGKPAAQAVDQSVVDESALNFDLDGPDFSTDHQAENGDLNFDLDAPEPVADDQVEASADSDLQFELDPSEMAAVDSGESADSIDLDFGFDEADESAGTGPGTAGQNAAVDSDPVFDMDESEAPDSADFGEAEESIFGDAALDFALDEPGTKSDDDAKSAGQSVDDDSGLHFELDDLDGVGEPEIDSAEKSDPRAAAEGKASTAPVDGGPDDFQFESGRDASDEKPASRVTAASLAGKAVNTRSVGSIEKIFRSLNSEQQLNQVLNTVLRTLQKVVPFDLAVLMTRQINNPQYLQIKELVVRGTVKSVQYNKIPFKGAELAAVMKKGKSLILDDTSLLKGPLEKKMFCQHGLAACLFIPLSINGSAAGVLTLGARKQGTFDKTRQYVEWVANGIALAIERDRMALEARKQQLALRSTEQIGQALIAMKFDIDKVMKLVLNIVLEQMNTEAGFVYLKSADGLTLTCGTRPDGKAAKKLKLKPAQGIAWQVVKQHGPILLNDMSQLTEEYVEGKGVFNFETRSVLSVPLQFDGKTTGVIEVRNKREGDYDAGDEMLLQSIGAALGIAVANANCFKQKKRSGKPEKDVLESLQKYISKQAEQVPA